MCVCESVCVCVMQDSRWAEEKQNLIRVNQDLKEKIASLEQCELRLRSEVRDTLDQNELLEFRILELEERERRSPAFNLQISASENNSSLQLHCRQEGVKDVIIPDLLKKLDLLGDNGELFSKQKGFLEEELDYRKQALDHAQLRVQELEATLYSTLQQDPDSCVSESLTDHQRARLTESIEALRRQILRQSRHADTLVLQQRMELLQAAQQRIRELEDKIDTQRRQIKEIEEKVCMLNPLSLVHVLNL
ncbi:hypothetical protein DNTS_006239 [Danionella cerebrum]|uniref:Janus kinase and microtubule-interacting protein C-terminal domain-containing protein n=1 Tax=Danionella cerebrum TaxID=2873325 RepID=A0A553R7P6_9TELE|nr:hypothetical protein DNTS_006239 [Danionella translucida]